MAKNWKKAQENELNFWKSIYIEEVKDISTYKKISDEESIDFTKKIFSRHAIDIERLKGMNLLDVGCGPYGVVKGLIHLLELYPEYEYKIIGSDPLMNFYKTLNTFPCNQNLTLQEATGESLPNEVNSVDCVMSSNVLDHVENPKLVISEISRVVKVDGVFCVSVHVVKSHLSFMTSFIKYFDKNHPHHFTEKTFSKILSSKFHNVEVTYRASMLEDHPEFALRYVFKSSSVLRGIKRYLSDWILLSVSFNCRDPIK